MIQKNQITRIIWNGGIVILVALGYLVYNAATNRDKLVGEAEPVQEPTVTKLLKQD